MSPKVEAGGGGGYGGRQGEGRTTGYTASSSYSSASSYGSAKYNDDHHKESEPRDVSFFARLWRVTVSHVF